MGTLFPAVSVFSLFVFGKLLPMLNGARRVGFMLSLFRIFKQAENAILFNDS